MNLFTRGTLLIPSGPEHDPKRKHLHIICTNPDSDGRQLLVSVCKIVGDLYDRTCVLSPNEHDFLKVESFVYYKRARIVWHRDLRTNVENEYFLPREDLVEEVFDKVCAGIIVSRRMKPLLKNYFLNNSGDYDRAA